MYLYSILTDISYLVYVSGVVVVYIIVYIVYHIIIPFQLCPEHNFYMYSCVCIVCTELAHPPQDLHFGTTLFDTLRMCDHLQNCNVLEKGRFGLLLDIEP